LTNKARKTHADLRVSQDRASKARRDWPFSDPREDLSDLMLAMCAAALFPSLLELMASPTNPACKVVAIAAVMGALPGSKPPPPGLRLV
jgi:hypothetical protein